MFFVGCWFSFAVACAYSMPEALGVLSQALHHAQKSSVGVVLAPEYAAAGTRRKLDMELCQSLIQVGLDVDHEARVVFESKTDKRDERSLAPKMYLATAIADGGLSRGSFAACRLAVMERCGAPSLAKTSEMDAIHDLDSSSEEEPDKDNEEEKTRKILLREGAKGAQRYRQLGSEAWLSILTSLVDKHAEADQGMFAT